MRYVSYMKKTIMVELVDSLKYFTLQLDVWHSLIAFHL